MREEPSFAFIRIIMFGISLVIKSSGLSMNCRYEKRIVNRFLNFQG